MVCYDFVVFDKGENQMKKIVIVLCAALVIFAVYTNMQKQKAMQNTGKKNVYAVLPLTGAFAEFGKNIQKDIDVFMKDNNYSFTVKYIDSEGKPDKAITALQQATLMDDHPIVLSVFSTVAVALAPFIQQKGGFLFGISTITHTNTKNFLQMGPDASVYVSPVVDYLKKRNYKNVALFFIQDEYGLKQRKFLMEQLKNTSAQVRTEIAMSLSNPDVRIEVYKVMSAHPDAILVEGLPSPGYLNIIRELKAQGYQGTIIADASLRQPWILKVLGENADDVLFPVMQEEMAITYSEKISNFRQYLTSNDLATAYLTFETYDALSLIQYTLDHNLPFAQDTYENIKGWTGIVDSLKFKGETAYGHIYVLAMAKNGMIVPIAESEEK